MMTVQSPPGRTTISGSIATMSAPDTTTSATWEDLANLTLEVSILITSTIDCTFNGNLDAAGGTGVIGSRLVLYRVVGGVESLVSSSFEPTHPVSTSDKDVLSLKHMFSSVTAGTYRLRLQVQRVSGSQPIGYSGGTISAIVFG